MKRAGEHNAEAAGQEGETAPAHHHDDHTTTTTTTASLNKKKPRRGGGLVDDALAHQEEGALIEEWNLLCDLPYVAFRHLLDFLSSSPANAGVPPSFVDFIINLVINLVIDSAEGVVWPGAVPRARRERAVRW